MKTTTPSLFTALLAMACLTLGSTAFAAGNHDHDMSKAIKEYRELNETEQSIQGVLNKYAQAMEERSVEVMESAVIPGDFSTIESGYPNWTWESFRDTHLAAEFKMFSDSSYVIDLIVGETQGSLGFAVFRYKASGSAHGRTVSISGLGTAVMEETDDGWRIHHMHTSAPRDQLEKAAGGGNHDSGGGHGE